MKRITIKDVAQHAGVSTSTVSQYLNGRFHYMGEETKRRVADAIEALGYRPNYMARNLKNQSTKTIGIIVSNILHHFAVTLTREIEDLCDRDGYNLIICNADDDPKKERKYINSLLEKQVDGLIIMPTTGNDQLYRNLSDQQFPVAFVDRHMKEIEIPAFQLDNAQVISLAYEALEEKGVEHYYYIGAADEMNLTPRVERLETFRELAALNGKEAHHIITGTNDVLYDRIEAEFKQGKDTGIILANDFALMSFLDFANETGLELSEDLHLVAIDDIPLADVYRPRITTIAQPIQTIAHHAYMTVMQTDDRVESGIHSFEGELIRR